MKHNRGKDISWGVVIGFISILLILPTTRNLYIQWNSTHPYLLGFIKFAILATMGEILAKRIVAHSWKWDKGLPYKAVIWGVIGVTITFVFSFYSKGVAAMVEGGTLPIFSGWGGILLIAFYTSGLMNLTFGPVFMAAHRISDTLIDQKINGSTIPIKESIATINWGDFINFVVVKTIPLIWIPAHTITFLLPNEYRVLAAAYLSIVLGVLLSLARTRGNK
jgi:hypothetical protein